MAMRDRRPESSPWAPAYRVTAMVTQFAVSAAAGIMGGAWADEKLGTSPWLALLGMVLGLGAGIELLLVMVRKFEKLEKENNKEDP